MMKKRVVGRSGLEMAPLVVGGHSWTDFRDLWKKPKPEVAVELFDYLVESGMTHFDCTYREERQEYGKHIRRTGLGTRLRPVIWHGWHDQVETSAEQYVSNVRYELDELGCEKAGFVVTSIAWNRSNPWAAEAHERLKELGVTEGTALGIGGDIGGEQFVYETWKQWDLLALFWNYSVRRQQLIVEFARDHGIATYTMGAFSQGSILELPGVNAERLARPWLKWILREPSVSGFALSLANLEQARVAVEACNGEPMTPEDVAILHEMNPPIQYLDYRQTPRGAELQDLSITSPDVFILRDKQMVTLGAR